MVMKSLRSDVGGGGFKSVRILPLVLMIAFFYAESVFGALITNGSLTGPIDNDGVPSGWVIISGSPDTMDENNNVGTGAPFGVAPSGPSPDGGTWVGFGRNGSFIETFGQLVNGLTIGTQYDLSWYQGNFGAAIGPGYTGPNAIEVLIDSSSAGSGSLLPLGPNWTTDSILFTATSTSHQIDFRLLNTTTSYLSIDGIALVPEPATLSLLVLGSLVVLKRRR